MIFVHPHCLQFSNECSDTREALRNLDHRGCPSGDFAHNLSPQLIFGSFLTTWWVAVEMRNDVLHQFPSVAARPCHLRVIVRPVGCSISLSCPNGADSEIRRDQFNQGSIVSTHCQRHSSMQVASSGVPMRSRCDKATFAIPKTRDVTAEIDGRFGLPWDHNGCEVMWSYPARVTVLVACFRSTTAALWRAALSWLATPARLGPPVGGTEPGSTMLVIARFGAEAARLSCKAGPLDQEDNSAVVTHTLDGARVFCVLVWHRTVQTIVLRLAEWAFAHGYAGRWSCA